jgi:hypothetical protein
MRLRTDPQDPIHPVRSCLIGNGQQQRLVRPPIKLGGDIRRVLRGRSRTLHSIKADALARLRVRDYDTACAGLRIVEGCDGQPVRVVPEPRTSRK